MTPVALAGGHGNPDACRSATASSLSRGPWIGAYRAAVTLR
jgi:hypothetical protein